MPAESLQMNESSFQARFIIVVLLVGTLTVGLGIRLIDLDDPPLDFNPTRQLRSAIIARGLYYERTLNPDPEKQALAIAHMASMERLEPPIMETIVAWTYQIMGKETLWVARVFSSIFWIVGAVALYDLGRQMSSSWTALVGLGYFLFLPFSIRASRSFQPDPGMVMLILWTAWALYHWSEKRSWKWAVLVGIFGGLSGLFKITGLFFTAGMAIGVSLYNLGEITPSTSHDQKARLRILLIVMRFSQSWVIGLLMILPALSFHLLNNGEQSSSYFTNWTLISRWQEVIDPSFYMRWMIRVDDLLMLGLVLAGLIGSLVTSFRNRSLLWGIWAGYFSFGLVFPYHTITHDYYHLPLVGVVSLSMVPLTKLVWDIIIQRGKIAELAFLGILLVFFTYNAWIGRSILIGQDFRAHPAYWRDVNSSIPEDAKVVGVTQDYGFRLMYYGWRKIAIWPTGAGSQDYEERCAGAEYFLITAKNQLSDEMADYLEDHFPIYARGPGYLIYDCQTQK